MMGQGTAKIVVKGAYMFHYYIKLASRTCLTAALSLPTVLVPCASQTQTSRGSNSFRDWQWQERSSVVLAGDIQGYTWHITVVISRVKQPSPNHSGLL